MDNKWLIEKSFDSTQCEKYILSIRCSPDGFSFCVFDPESQQVKAYFHKELNTQTIYHLKNEINQVLHQEPIVKQDFNRTVVSYSASEECFTPIALVSEKYFEKVFNLAHPQQPENTILHHSISAAELIFSFSFPILLKEFFEINFSNVNYFTHGLLLAKQAMKNSANGLKLWVDKLGHKAFFMVSNARQIQFFNSYFVKNETDLLYFTLSIARLFPSEKSVEVAFSGELEPKSDYFQQLKRYGLQPFYRRSSFLTKQKLSEPIHHPNLEPLIEQCLCE
jgi:hypothetical protein